MSEESNSPLHQNWGRHFGWCSELSQIKTHIKSLIERQNIDQLDTRGGECGANIRDTNQRDNYEASAFKSLPTAAQRAALPRVIVLCCCRGKAPTPSSRSLWCHSLFHSSVETRAHYSSANVDPVVTCQCFLLRPARRTRSCLTLMDNSSSSLCSTRHLMCHFD